MPHSIGVGRPTVVTYVVERPLLVLVAVLLAAAWTPLQPTTANAGDPKEPLPGLQTLDTPLTPLLGDEGDPPEANIVQRVYGKTADMVIVLSMDGLRPDAITPKTRSLHKLLLQGVSPFKARTIDKSTTLPSHASMVSGFQPDAHGLRFNSWRPNRPAINTPTIFSVAREAGLDAAMFVGKHKLKHLIRGAADDVQFTRAGIFCTRVLREALPYIREHDSGVVFLHFADPDGAGHRHGWMTPEYMTAVRRTDRCLEKLLDTIEDNGKRDRTLLLATSDHGGHGRTHGTRLRADQRIPWFAWGAGVNHRRRVTREVRTVDTAATALAALGLPLPEAMDGQPVLEALGGIPGPSGLPLLGWPLEL